MNGAQAVVRTLVDSGVTTCFANPGTSEMHFVAALDAVPEMRGVLCLFEGVGDRRGRRLRPDDRRPGGRRCCTWARAWPTGWPTCTTPAARTRRCSRSSATTPPTTSGSTRRWSPTSTRSPGSVSGWVRRSLRSADAPGDAADGGRRCAGAARSDRHADPARRRDLDRRGRARRAASPRGGGRAVPDDVISDGRRRAAQRGADRDPARRRRRCARRRSMAASRIAEATGPGSSPRRSRHGTSAARAFRPSSGSPTWWRPPRASSRTPGT